MCKLIIVDDNDQFRSTTAWLLELEGYEVVQYRNAEKAIKYLERNHNKCLHCCLLDVRMPGTSGLKLHDILKEKKIEVPVIYITGHGNVSLAVEAMRKGAVNFIEKPIDTDILFKSIKQSIKRYESSEKTLKLSTEMEEFSNKLKTLTPRENQILDQIVSGKMNKNIACELGISIKTVELHRSRVMNKLNAKTAAELVRNYLSCR